MYCTALGVISIHHQPSFSCHRAKAPPALVLSITLKALARPPASWQESLGKFMTLSFHTLSLCPDRRHWAWQWESSPRAQTLFFDWAVCCQNTDAPRRFSKPPFGKKLLKIPWAFQWFPCTDRCSHSVSNRNGGRGGVCAELWSYTVWWGTDVPTWEKGRGGWPWPLWNPPWGDQPLNAQENITCTETYPLCCKGNFR